VSARGAVAVAGLTPLLPPPPPRSLRREAMAGALGFGGSWEKRRRNGGWLVWFGGFGSSSLIWDLGQRGRVSNFETLPARRWTHRASPIGATPKLSVGPFRSSTRRM
jgi:hypothetical protein